MCLCVYHVDALQRLIDLALETDENNAEALQTLTSVRLSQQRPNEASQCLERAWGGWKDLDLGALSSMAAAYVNINRK